ncbi:MAG TPA: cation diffusion facilitator family transporter [archaeon]|nr:cation diffusion facilitator family transporter [archaeon]
MTHDHSDINNHKSLLQTTVESRRLLWWAFLINLVFLGVEVAGGLISGSLALLADAGHMFTDVAALGLAIIAAYLAGLPPNSKRTFGLLRVEVIGAFINGASLVVIVGFIVWESWQRLSEPVEIHGPVMLTVAVLGLAANLASALILLGRRKENINIQAAFLHMAGDALGSAGAIVAGVVILATGWTPIDTITSLAIAVIILWGSLGLLRRTVNIIINATPEDINYDEVKKALLTIKHFDDLHDLHIWCLSTGFPVLSAHVCLNPTCSDSVHWQQCLRQAQDMLRERFGIVHSTLQLEPTGYEKDKRPL